MNAKEMFKKLGFKTFEFHNKTIEYYDGKGLTIGFNLEEKTIDINTDSGEELWGNRIYNFTSLDWETFKAIEKQIEELKW